MIKDCTCKHKYQDARYGKNKRVHNETEKKTQRCTVCEKEKTGGFATKTPPNMGQKQQIGG